MVEVLESHLLALRPEPDSIVDEVRALVDAAESDHGMHRAEELAAQASMSCAPAGARQRGWTSSAVPLPATRVSTRVDS